MGAYKLEGTSGRQDVTNLVAIAPGTVGYYTASEFRAAARITVVEYRKLTVRGALVARFRAAGYAYVLYDDADVERVIRMVEAHRLKQAEAEERLGSAAPGRPPSKEKKLPYTAIDARKVIRMLKHGRRHDDIFLETNVHPETILVIARAYERMIGAVYVTGDQMQLINELPLEGVELPIRSAKQILDAFRALADASKSCNVCGEEPPLGACLKCSRRRVLASIAKQADKQRRIAEIAKKAHEADERAFPVAASEEKKEAAE